MVANNERRGIKVEYTVPEIIRREAQARQRLAFEAKLLEGSFKSERDVQAFIDTQPLREANTAEYQGLYDKFSKQVHDTEAAEVAIKEILFSPQEDEDNAEFPEEWGVRFFEHWVGTLPEDVVIFHRLPNYFQVICESDNDYIALVSVLYPNRDNSRNLGIMHNRKPINLEGVDGKINLMLITGRKNDTTTQEVITHERQHAMNDLEIEEFTSLETSAFIGKKLYIAREQRGIAIEQFVELKDELLANFRQRRVAEDIRDGLLSYELFDSLEDLSNKLLDNTLKLFHKIIDEFAELQPLLETEEEYGLLVYQLNDIPLLDFPKYIRAYCYFLETDVSRVGVAAK